MKKNIGSITRLLKEKNISVKVAVLGGTERKGIFMNIESSSFYYMQGDTKQK